MRFESQIMRDFPQDVFDLFRFLFTVT